jgi:hypothetical protein
LLVVGFLLVLFSCVPVAFGRGRDDAIPPDPDPWPERDDTYGLLESDPTRGGRAH